MEQEKQIRQFIFISKSKTDVQFLLLDIGCENDGRKATGRRVNYSGLKMPAKMAGTIFEMESTANGESISYSKIFAPKGWWKNSEDRVGWQVEQREQEDLIGLEKITKTDDLEELLLPIKNKLRNTHTRAARAVILARVIDYLTGGR